MNLKEELAELMFERECLGSIQEESLIALLINIIEAIEGKE